KKIGPDPRNFNQRVSLGRNDLLIRTFLKIGSRAIAFVEREVDEWISQRIEERDAVISTKSQL
ncbi:AlpA family phage regulatory protein, partial [Klebsiella pneumoniae]|nr:AlpA family phage regulatory protein [Klebsiella pneumoniae]